MMPRSLAFDTGVPSSGDEKLELIYNEPIKSYDLKF